MINWARNISKGEKSGMTDCRVVYPRRLEFLLVNSGKTLRADLVEKFRKSFLDLLVCVTFRHSSGGAQLATGYTSLVLRRI